MRYLGDFRSGQSVHFLWNTNAADGSSITRATNGTIRVYKNNGTTETTVGVTDAEDFDGLTGVHAVTIATSDVFYSTGGNYSVVLVGAVIDGKTVNAELASFSIENRLADAFLDKAAGVETGITVRQALRIVLAACAGKLSGAATTAVAIRDVADTKNRITATVDANGNRTATAVDGT